MPSIITESHFYRYADCPSWVYRNETGKPRELEPLRALLHLGGLLPDVKRETLMARGYEEIDEEDPKEASARTLEAMTHGAQTILHGALLHGRYLVRPDVLERVEGRSRFGSYYYVACFFHPDRTPSTSDKLAMCFAADVLALVQGTKPTQGYVLTRRGRVRTVHLEPFEKQYHLTLHHLERVLEGEEPPLALSSHCKQSPWFSVCASSAESCDSLVRINRIYDDEVKAFEDAGVKTVSTLARMSLRDLTQKHVAVSSDRLEWIKTQAESLVSGAHKVLRPIQFEAAKSELYFDIESDPLRDVDVVLGVLEVTEGKETYHAFFAATPSEEEAMWKQFVEFLESRTESVMYHYGWFETEEVRRLSGRYETPDAVRTYFATRMRDLLGLLRPAVIFPLSFYSLKDLAVYAGFHWRDEGMVGQDAVFLYEDFLARGEPSVREKLLRYNEDDVRATYALKQWLQKNAL